MQGELFNSLENKIRSGDSKICNKCKRELPTSSFSFHGGSNYLRPECKRCNNELAAERQRIKDCTPDPESSYQCPICLSTEVEAKGAGNSKNGAWCLDHDHKTKTFRGWLCHRCNRGIGCFSDDIDKLERAIQYLRKNDASI